MAGRDRTEKNPGGHIHPSPLPRERHRPPKGEGRARHRGGQKSMMAVVGV